MLIHQNEKICSYYENQAQGNNTNSGYVKAITVKVNTTLFNLNTYVFTTIYFVYYVRSKENISLTVNVTW